MSNAGNLDIALLLLRLSCAYVFLLAAFRCTQTKAAFARIKHETETLFPFLPAGGPRERIAGYSAVIGMAMCYGGGLSVLLNIEPRLGGLDIAIFSFMGLRVHIVNKATAIEAAMKGDVMGMSAAAGLGASQMKNWVVIAAGLTFFLLGGGKYGFGLDCTGKALGWSN